jgi:sugar phosphate isomerase/epimerase
LHKWSVLDGGTDMVNIGLQLYSIREAAEKDFLGTIELVGDMGYRGIQFAGFFNTPTNDLKKVMDQKGIVPAGSHINPLVFESLEDQLDEVLQFNNEIGNNLIICPSISEELRKTRDDYKRRADAFNKIGTKCKQNGFIFAYHNHNFEFDLFNNERGFDILFENTDPELVKIELDCYWATYAGLDPTSIIKKYGDRIVSLHIKDLKHVNGEKRSIEIGSGELDFSGLVKVGQDNGIKWFIVEQEQFDADPMESCKINIQNLKPLITK